MTFEQYCAVIESTARAHGWCMFLPSLCEVSPKPQLRVYETLPPVGSDQMVARQWAESLTRIGTNLFLAYRDSEGLIQVEEIRDGKITRTLLLNIARPTYGACG